MLLRTDNEEQLQEIERRRQERDGGGVGTVPGAIPKKAQAVASQPPRGGKQLQVSVRMGILIYLWGHVLCDM